VWHVKQTPTASTSDTRGRDILCYIDSWCHSVFNRETREKIERWRQQATPPEQQIDRRWVERYRKLVAYDSYWWLTWAGPFTQEEQKLWDSLFMPSIDEARKVQLAPFLKKSRERELEAALEQQREPSLRYPAIDIAEIHYHIGELLRLNKEIEAGEPHPLVRRLYHEVIEDELNYMFMIEATYEGDTERFWEYNLRLFPPPMVEEMEDAFTDVRHILAQGFTHPETVEIARRFDEFLRTRLLLSFDDNDLKNDIKEVQPPSTSSFPGPEQKLSAQAARCFFEEMFRECGYDSWQAQLDPNARGARIEQGLRCLFLPEKDFSLTEVRHLLSHELLGHVARLVAGERSPLGLLGIYTRNSMPTEEGLALYYERQIAALHGQTVSDSGIRNGTFAIGLASGIVTPPQSFLSILTFFELFSLLTSLVASPNAERQKAQQQGRAFASTMCLRAFRGVPDLQRTGVCYCQDAIYLRGLRLIQREVAQNPDILDYLAVGVIGSDLLPDMQSLGITAVPQPLRELAYDPDLDAYIMSFSR
jgi:hypothetical protein